MSIGDIANGLYIVLIVVLGFVSIYYKTNQKLKDNVTDFKPNTDSVKCADCGKEMKPAEVTYSQKFYQGNICMTCQKKHTRIEGAK
jgi:DNA-directed RNA polymerase subunit RPC12/RpoP